METFLKLLADDLASGEDGIPVENGSWCMGHDINAKMSSGQADGHNFKWPVPLDEPVFCCFHSGVNLYYAPLSNVFWGIVWHSWGGWFGYAWYLVKGLDSTQWQTHEQRVAAMEPGYEKEESEQCLRSRRPEAKQAEERLWHHAKHMVEHITAHKEEWVKLATNLQQDHCQLHKLFKTLWVDQDTPEPELSDVKMEVKLNSKHQVYAHVTVRHGKWRIRMATVHYPEGWGRSATVKYTVNPEHSTELQCNQPADESEWEWYPQTTCSTEEEFKILQSKARDMMTPIVAAKFE